MYSISICCKGVGKGRKGEEELLDVEEEGKEEGRE